MPFKSKDQIAKIAELEKQGKVAKGTVKQWASETPNMHKLPQRIGPKKEPAFRSIDQLKQHYKRKFGG